MAAAGPSASEEHYRIHKLYSRGDHDECLALIEQCVGRPNSAPLRYPIFVKAMILRQQGHINESLRVLEHSVRLDPGNAQNLKQVGCSLHLLGKHKVALEVYEEALTSDPTNWELWHGKGLCLAALKQLSKAQEAFRQALRMEPQECTYLQLARAQLAQGDVEGAIAVFRDASRLSPHNPEIITQMGLLHMRKGRHREAFELLTRSAAMEGTNSRALLALGSIMQDGLDLDAALQQYCSAAAKHAHSAQVWNNVGMCFFGKQRYIAAIACLKRALYLAPFDWIAAYNLGLVHLNTAQHASAFHYFSAAINLRPSFAHTYMYLGVTLAKLHDFDNAKHAYLKAIEKDPNDPLFHLNFAVTLYNSGDVQSARERFAVFNGIYDALDEQTKNADSDLVEQAAALGSLLAC